MGADKVYPPLLPEQEEYVVEYDGPDDPLYAQNWEMSKKCVYQISRHSLVADESYLRIYIRAILAVDALSATMGSSIFSPGIGQVSLHFGVIMEVGTLGTSLFVFGYALGPLVSLFGADRRRMGLLSNLLYRYGRQCRNSTAGDHLS
jgi:DHA1 family multidrug resistance protein-like MFS transporter